MPPQPASKKKQDEPPQTDYMLVVLGLIALISMGVIYYSDKYILPQLSSTYTLQPVVFFNLAGLADDFTTKTAFEASEWKTKYKLHPVGALKYSLGCFGTQDPTIFSHSDDAMKYVQMSTLQKTWDTDSAISVCTCVDHHVRLAMPAVVTKGVTILGELRAIRFVDRSVIQKDAILNLEAYKLDGNVFVDLADEAAYTTMVEIKDWCVETAAPQYSVHFASVFNSKLMLLVGLSLIFVSLDVLGVRRKSYTTQSHMMFFVWFLDIIPLVFFIFQWYQFQSDSKLVTKVDVGSSAANSFLLVVSGVTAGASTLLLLLLTFFSKVMYQNLEDQNTEHYNELFERVFMDVPLISGLSLVGIALKMQNAEHDETILTTTFVLLLTGGLVQHISNIIKIVYDILCSRLAPQVLQELQCASTSTPSGHMNETKHILQYFGWTRMYGFVLVVVFALFSMSISSTSASTHNPLSIYTQNQYMYFVFAFIVALTGLDFFYEVLPFVTEVDEDYGVKAADRLRKVSILGYIIFVMISQYTTESQEL